MTHTERMDLFRQNTRLVRWVFNRSFQQLRLRHAGEITDFMQEGYLGLWKATETYNANFGTTFATFATKAIHRQMTDYQQMQGVIRRGSRVWNLTNHESKTKWLKASYPQTLDTLPGNDRSRASRHGESPAIPDPHSREALEEVEEALDKGSLLQLATRFLLSKIKPRHRQVIEAYFLGERSLEEVGQSFGFSKERARQIVTKSLATMRQYLDELDNRLPLKALKGSP